MLEQVLKEGVRVIAHRRGEQHAQKLRAAYPDNESLQIQTGDICDARHRTDLIRTIENEFGRLDILVNSAGKVVLGNDSIHEPDNVWRDTFEINLFALVGITQACVPLLEKSKAGNIINISSVCSLYPYDSCSSAAYSASKAAVDMYTKTLARQLAPQNIRVNAINPGVVHSNIMNSAGLPPGDQKAFKDDILTARHPLGRLGQPEDIAAAASYLASDSAGWVTGTMLSVDGGYSVS